MVAVDAKILGMILLIESLVAQLPSKDAMLQFAARGLEALPGVGRRWFQDGADLPDQGDIQTFEVRRAGHCHAVLCFEVLDQALFLPYVPYLKNLTFMLGIVLDERLQREENERYRTQLEKLVELRTQALQESETRARTMLRTALDGVWLVDADTCLLEVNEAACAMLGYSHDELVGMKIEAIEAQETPAEVQVHHAWLIQHGAHLFESRHRRKDGSEFPVEISETIHPDLRQAVVFIRDITERKRSEEALCAAFQERHQLELQIAASQKLEGLGSLAGGVAHDMNNVLGAILALASSSLESLPETSALHDTLATIAKAATRGGEMVKGLLNFARKTPVENVAVDLNRVLTDVIRLLERTTLARIRMVLELQTGLWPMRGDPSALVHSVMNLCVNAVDAMSSEGTLTVRSRNVDGQRVEIEVQDTGGGMTQEVLQRAMDPFFTTKEVGRGTGLGLAMVYGMVKAHQGRIDLQSEPGQGTRVVLSFPAMPGSIPAPAPEPPQPAAQAGRKVLLIDDDDLIQVSVRAILSQLGHSTIVARSGEEALAWLEASGQKPEVVILDLNMPGLSGAGTLPRLRAALPEVPVILATGKPDQAALELVAPYSRVTLLAKPFTIGDLRQQFAQLGL